MINDNMIDIVGNINMINNDNDSEGEEEGLRGRGGCRAARG